MQTFTDSIDTPHAAATAPRTIATAWWRVASFAVFFLAWEIAGRVPVSLAFPPLSSVVAALMRLTLEGDLPGAYADTFPPLAIGIVCSSLLGLSAGIAMGLLRPIEWLLYPLLIVMQTAPMAAIIPLITQFYGVGAAAKVLAVVILSTPIVVLNSFKGIRDTNASLLEMCRSFMGSRWQEITKVILPSASAMIFAGLRLSISGGFIGIVLAELLISPTGIGDVISYNSSVARYPEMYAAIVSIVALATFTLMLLQWLERRLFGAARPGQE